MNATAAGPVKLYVQPFMQIPDTAVIILQDRVSV
jgi:hypothetical protein